MSIKSKLSLFFPIIALINFVYVGFYLLPKEFIDFDRNLNTLIFDNKPFGGILGFLIFSFPICYVIIIDKTYGKKLHPITLLLIIIQFFILVNNIIFFDKLQIIISIFIILGLTLTPKIENFLAQ